MDRQEIYKKTYEITSNFFQQEPPKRVGDMTIGEKGILNLLLAKYPEPIYSGDFSILLHVGTGRIGNALKTLESKKYIKRIQDEEDKRKVSVHLTDLGYRHIKNQSAQFEKMIDKIVSKLGEEKYITILENVKDLALTIKKIDKEGCMDD